MYLRSLSLYYRPFCFGGFILPKTVGTLVCGRRHAFPWITRGLFRYFITGQTRLRESFYITTPIFYVNAAPHIGHLYTVVLADAAARWHRLCGAQVSFSTGTDEHGLKIQRAAAKNNVSPQELCDTVADKFKHLFDLADISYSDFIRTTESHHLSAVRRFWTTLEEAGYIYRGHYEGWYSPSDEAFIADNDVLDEVSAEGKSIKVSRDSGQPVEWMKEENYMFRLSDFTSKLKDWIDTGVVQPRVFEPLVRGWLEEGLPDLSVSRQADRLQWGITTPNDSTHTIYVWLDALVNYLTVAGYPELRISWPPSCQVIGKDILKFHAIYWPAFLMAAGLKPPEKILCHSHWTVDGIKMSKSRGNVVDPFQCLDRFTSDGIRYFLLKEGVPHSDGNFSERRVVECINSQLVNTLGNLLSRATSRSINPRQEAPSVDMDFFHQVAAEEDRTMLRELASLPERVGNHYCSMNLNRALDDVISQLHQTNAFVQRYAPWSLARDPQQGALLSLVLGVALETLRVAGILLQPVVPRLTNRLLSRLGISEDKRSLEDLKGILETKSQARPLGHSHGVLIHRLKT